MADSTITCPHCLKSIELTGAMSADIEKRLRADFEAQRAKLVETERARAQQELSVDLNAMRVQLEEQTTRLTEARAREADLAKRERDIEDRKKTFERELHDRLQAERAALLHLARKEATEASALRVSALVEDNERNRAKLAEAQTAELALRKQKLALEDEKREFDLEKQRAIDAERTKILEKAQRDASEAFRLPMAEKDKLIADMQKQVDELKRKSDQGSQQLQGEVQELELEATLRAAFPRDTIEPVPKGAFGGDALHRVADPAGNVAGTIIWESKRTKAWSDGWLAKLRGDQREAKAEIAVIVTATMPKGVDTFAQQQGVWVASAACAMPLAHALRQELINVSAARQASEGRHTKMELVYNYLTGPGFRQRVEAIMEAWVTMRADLENERKVITKSWAKRAAQIDVVTLGTVGLYGDLQGIAGKGMPEIEGLEMRALDAGEAPTKKGRAAHE